MSNDALPPALLAAYETALRQGGSGDFIQDTRLHYLQARGIFTGWADQPEDSQIPAELLSAKRAVLADGQPRRLTVRLFIQGCAQPVSLSLAAMRAEDGSISGLVGIGHGVPAADADPQAAAALFAKANHDLRQPFQAMRLFLHLLESRAADPRQGELIQRLGDAVESAAHQVSSLLDLSVLQAGTAKLSPGPVPLGPLLARLVEEHQEQAASLDVRLRHVPSELTVQSDGMMLDRLLRQLLGNALRHAGRGGKVLLAARRRGHLAALEVWDSGPGIAPDDQERIFQPFVQLEEAGQGRRGLGLGLAIVQRGAQALGHRVTLESAPGKGCRFSLLANRHGMAPPSPAPAAESLPEAPLVAVLEDDRLQLAALEMLLQEWGYRTAVGGSQTELQGELAGRQPDLIITDLHLPGGQSGPDLVQALRARYGSAVPALLLTGDGTAEARRKAEAAGMALLGKPAMPARLRRAVEQALGTSRPV
ncbi:MULTISPECIES: hybrid sensor histidine kinase/response regulator [unclassified Azospirillum]|uniref:ATP-binding response regulator n=1 Tax=unclassified Azospirillum TaxID=2630922 RepID=UPI000B6FF70F|nr:MULTISPECIES: hybrid sensor histidine kinase/response regulator [unclassified Azospirillum]SNS37581.1 His Kinase A (phospho-acceptor) domain-containing protein [Azospirillum sp. RU38E]SNS56120.1 His Kinase A (phospho-acceptor) domain-containing protein [Azospirillum sp. RU37A]